MNPQEAKFILRAHRADGRHAPDDPVFAEALAETERSPALAEWLAREHALDATVANKLDAIQPPAGLRETILAGSRVSQPTRVWWRQPRWLGLAAGFALAAALPMAWHLMRTPVLSTGTFAHLTVEDYARREHHHVYTAPLAAIAHALATRPAPFSAGLDLTTASLRDANCTALDLGNRETYEVCFERDGVWFHLYVTRLDRRSAPDHDRRPVFLQQDALAAAAWTDGEHLYSLVTSYGTEALQKVV
jgi:hypothetical protein